MNLIYTTVRHSTVNGFSIAKQLKLSAQDIHNLPHIICMLSAACGFVANSKLQARPTHHSSTHFTARKVSIYTDFKNLIPVITGNVGQVKATLRRSAIESAAECSVTAMRAHLRPGTRNSPVKRVGMDQQVRLLQYIP